MKHVIRFAVGAGMMAVACFLAWLLAVKATRTEVVILVIVFFLVPTAYFIGSVLLGGLLDGKTWKGWKF